ncbi:PIG-L deacetylase family protein [Salinicola aestuarinus]|uniref:PIG-L deacetylase family protein n=1 Tax=Salinicola aestuarinus TaxID=1949082 RepID=UPI000DA1522F|nr:PIG-L family deacetylase [Salinicola aestuarinus]
MNEERPHFGGSGTPLERWRDDPELADLPSLNLAAIFEESRRVVVIAPHPDDEILGCGGLLMQLHALGRELLLVSVTDGTGSHPGSSLWPAARLAATRPQESRRALARLGLASLETMRLRLTDTQVAGEARTLAYRLHRLLHDDDILLTTWRGDGHADHEATGEVCAALVDGSSRTVVEMPIWMWHWAEPGDARVPWHRAHRLPLDESARAAKRHAMVEHGSQCQPDRSTGAPPILSALALERLTQPHEVFLL